MADNMLRLLVSCQDQPGIVAAISQFFYAHQANIIDSDQHSTDPAGGAFFLRIVVKWPDTTFDYHKIKTEFEQTVAKRFDMHWRLSEGARKKRVAIFVSKHAHALRELLWMWSHDELPMDIAAVVSNHNTLEEEVGQFSIPFYHIPVTAENKAQAEATALDILQNKVECIVLARYMQVLTPFFLQHFMHSIINIHHSFLPAFIGANPYQQAYDKGVKLIGATAHYVTEALDMGPIIEQDITRVSHRTHVPDMRMMGKTLERQVLARAVKWHLEDRVIVHNNKTIVFR